MKRMIFTLAALALVATACASTEEAVDTVAPPETTAPAADTTTTDAVEEVVDNELTVVDSEFGAILADANGRTLYMFVPDNRSDSVCYGDCEGTWPVFYSPATSAGGIDASLMATTDRTDGTVQVTFNGWPLYYFAGDQGAGETNGQGRGEVWYVVSATGDPLLAADQGINQLTVVDSDFGQILADDAGNTLYIFVPDNRSDSVCYGDCEAAWPVFHVPSWNGDGVDGSLVASTDRTDETKQVTYNGWPLYYFANDEAPGDTNGQGRGNVWYVVSATGDPLAAADQGINQLTLVDSEFGQILADADGNTLYGFVPDAQGESTCYGDCEAAWPVFYVPSWNGDGVDGSLVASTDRTDETKQVTYDGWPLYYFANDEAPGDTNGQGRGDVWYVVGADGGLIQP